VWVSPDVDGMSLLIARMTTEQAHAVKTQIDADAFDRAFSVDAKAGLMMGEHRVEALAALVLGGKGTGSAPVRAHLNLTIDLPTLLGLRDQVVDGSAELAGAGPIPAVVVRELLQDPDCAVTIRRLVTDPVTGHLLDYGRRTYEVPQPLRDYIVARDRTCRFPGCVSKRREPITGGPTSASSTTQRRGTTAARRTRRTSAPCAPATIN